jgi:DNA-binding response OmpR family regulator
MPGREGWDILPDLARTLGVPVIVLTANADLGTRVRAFREGAVDYLAKPFFIEELAARIRSRLSAEAFGTSRPALDFGAVSIDLEARRVSVAGAELALTATEFDILAYLAARPGRAISRATLGDHVLPPDGERLERTIDSHVSRIRSKLGSEAGRVRTVWGIGWKWAEPEV